MRVRGVGLVKIELAAKIAPMSHKFRERLQYKRGSIQERSWERKKSSCQRFASSFRVCRLVDGNMLDKHLVRRGNKFSPWLLPLGVGLGRTTGPRPRAGA